MSERDAIDLRPWGYAPGSYFFRCIDCPPPENITAGAMGAKRSIRCEAHAVEARFLSDAIERGEHLPDAPAPVADAIVTDADREALEAIDDALGFLMDNERAIVLQAFARQREQAERGLREALRPFAECAEQISDDENDEEWAKFRLLIKDYRAARKALDTRP